MRRAQGEIAPPRVSLAGWKGVTVEIAKRFFGAQLSSEASDLRLGQVVCIATALLVLCLGLWKLIHLDVSEIELLIGLLLTFCISVLFVILGQLLWVSHYLKVWREAQDR